MEVIFGILILILIISAIWNAFAGNEDEADIICPYCKFHGKGKFVGGANGWVFFILLFLWIIPAFLYLLFAGKKVLVCPKCGVKIR